MCIELQILLLESIIKTKNQFPIKPINFEWFYFGASNIKVQYDNVKILPLRSQSEWIYSVQ